MKKRRGILRRILASALSAAMIGTMLPAAVMAAEETKPEGVIAQFDFDNETDGFTGGGAKATGTYSLEDSYNAEAGKALYLNGNSQFLNVTKEDGSSLLTGLKEMTVSFEMKSARTATNWPFYAAPSAATQPIGGSGKELYFGLLVNGGNITAERYLNGRSTCASTAMNSQWSHVDVVVGQADTTIYIDGVERSRVASTAALDSILGNSSILQIGKANWASGEYCQGWIDNMTIYNHALTAQELQAAVPEAYKQIALDAAEAAITEVKISDSKTALPDYEGTVTWKSDMEEIVIAENGTSAVVTQPAKGEAALKGELTAVITLFGATRAVKVPVTIEPAVNADDPYGYLMVHFVEDSAGYQEKIYLDISKGDNPQQWDPLNGRQPITASNLGTSGARDPFITYNPETKTYYIIATDLRVFGGDNAQWGVWASKGSTMMNVWESKDLIHWSDVRQFDVTLNEKGEKIAELGMMWAPETTWVPDYYGEGKGAFVVYWSSNQYALTDTEHTNSLGSNILWGVTTDFTQETFSYGGKFLDGGSAGAIDTTLIQENGKTYHITKSNGNDGEIIMESTTDKEWWLETTNWTRIQGKIGDSRYGAVEGPAVFKDHSKANSYYLFVDDLPQPGYQPMYSTNLDAGWDYLDSDEYYLAPMTKHGGVISLTKAQYDALRDADAVSAVKEDLGSIKVEKGQNAENVVKVLPAKAEVNLAYGRGTSSLPVEWDTSAVDMTKPGTYEVTGVVQSIGANKNQWIGKNNSTHYLAEDKQLYSSTAITVKASVEVEGSSEPLKPEIPEVLADFNFDADGSFFDGGNAKATGSYTLVDHGNGKALKLSGNGQHLVVTDKEDKSLLTGVKEMTVSYQIKPENSKTNWGFFAAPNADKQEYQQEHYLGIVDISGTTRAERYNGGARPAVASTQTGYNGWYYVTVVYMENSTALYINGEKAAEEASAYALADILGDNSILYIGKSTWVEGEYATSLIDNYKIVSKALTAEEVKAEAVKYVEKDALKAAIDTKVDAEDTYTAESWKVYADALTAANTVYNKKDASQAEVDAAAKTLTDAIKALKKKPVVAEVDKTALQEAIQNAVSSDQKDKYTEESWKAYEDALAKAKEADAEQDATQAEVDAAAKALTDAQKALKEKPKRPFVDVDMETGSWYYDAVYYNFDRGIMNGVNSTYFEPLSNLARAQFAIILHNMEGKPAVSYEPKFKDVAEGEWYTNAILWASSKKIVTGYTDGSEKFGWGDNILREQMAVMMYRYAKEFKKYDVSDSADFDKFADAASVNEYAKEAMKWAVGTGIITGKDNGTRLDPQGNASRAECAIIIQRFLEKYEK